MEWHSLLQLLISFLSILSLYHLFFKSNKQSQHPTSYPILGHLPQFIKNRNRFHDWMTEILAASPTNTIILRRPGNADEVITANPANVEHILKSNFDNYPKGTRFRSLLQDFLGAGIFNSDGHIWRLQRKTASFEFNTHSLRNFVVGVVQHETVARLLPLLSESADDSASVIDMQDVLERYGFDNMFKVAFNEDPACLTLSDSKSEHSCFADAFRDAADLSAGRFLYAIPGLWKIKKLLGVGSERRLKDSVATVHDFAAQIIRSRLDQRQHVEDSSSNTNNDDLLSRFIANVDQVVEEHSTEKEEFLRDIVISFILAGRESTSSALTWFFWLLSSRPEVEKRILDEVAAVRAKSQSQDQNEEEERVFEFDELREMQYLHAAITESMRLYPPVPMNMTTCQEDEVLPDGTEIKKGWYMSYNAYAMGRMERIWGKDCLEYRPERWLDEDGVFRPESPFKFLAFHGGPRMCLGKEMAYIQMKSIAACVLERFAVEVVGRDNNERPEKMLSLTLRMKGGLPVRVRRRREHGQQLSVCSLGVRTGSESYPKSTRICQLLPG